MNSILVCLDASPQAPLVLDAAIDLAKKTGAKLRLFRCIGLPPEVDQEFYVHSPKSMLDTMLEQAKEALAALAKDVSPALLASTHVRVGSPWDGICAEAKESDCDLIMIGSHGYSGLDRILGTTAAKVVNHADRSVLVVRPPSARKA